MALPRPVTPVSDAVWMAVALVLVIEGLLPAVNPTGWRHLFRQMTELPDHQVRAAGLVAMLIGLVMLWVA
jgi:uncharacterized protein YjeT (DUF2065 family)